MKGIALNLSISILSLGFFALICEGGTRLFWFEISSNANCISVDNFNAHKNKANCHMQNKATESEELINYNINDCGLREDRTCAEIVASRDAGEKLLLAIGDSFTYGSMVNQRDSYVRTAERELNSARTKEKLIYVNAGVPGYDLYQHSLNLKEKLYLKPAVVTLALLANDLFIDISEQGIKNWQELLTANGSKELYSKVYLEKLPIHERVLKSLIKQSRFVDFATHLAMSNDNLYASIYQKREGEDSFLQKKLSIKWQNKITDAARIVKDLKVATDAINAKLIVIFIPQRIQALILKRPDSFPNLDAYALSRNMQQSLAELGVESIDYLDHLKMAPNPTAYYFPVDGHLTPVGQRDLGKFVAREMKSLLR